MGTEATGLQFKYYFVDANGNATGFGAKRGTITDQCIVLKDAELPLTAVLETGARDKVLVLLLDKKQVPEKLLKHLTDIQYLILQISKSTPVELKRVIDRVTSVHRAKRHKDELEAAGKGDTFHCLVCPECEATLDVSGLPESHFVYCPYCDTIARHNGELVPSGANYRPCDECGWFDRVQGYTEFYFYFLLVVYGFSYKRRHLCDNCVNRVFWKALLINLIFILGIPPAIWMKIKSKIGRVEGFQDLGKANALARRGRANDALRFYNSALGHYPGHPGVLYSQGLGALAANDLPLARSHFEDALRHCCNYDPARALLEKLDQIEAQIAQSNPQSPS